MNDINVAVRCVLLVVGVIYAGFYIIAYLNEQQKKKIRNIISFRHALEQSIRKNPINETKE